MTDNNNYIKRSKKPKPLFGIFRTNKTTSTKAAATTDPLLGSGTTTYNTPIQSILSPIEQKPTIRYQTRPRSKSVGNRDPASTSSFQQQQQFHSRLMEERESAFAKLCGTQSNPTSPNSSLSLADSSILLSPSYNKKTAPPVPPIPLPFQVQAQVQQQPQASQQMQKPQTQPQAPKMRKFSSAHDLRKAAKLQQESIFIQSNNIALPPQSQPPPRPTASKSTSSIANMKRSKSLKLSNQQQKQQMQQQIYAKMPITPNIMLMSKPRFPPFSPSSTDENSDDDDDIPLGFLQQQPRPSSLLSDQEEEDDKDLIPIATTVHIKKENSHFQSAADKYKLKVKERLNLSQQDDEDDDDLPISSFLK